MARTRKTEWVEKGLWILKKEGETGLTVDRMCDVMGRTKGSFYHHFKNHADFRQRLLDLWEKRNTDEILNAADRFTEPRDRLGDMDRLALTLDLGIERRIRAWAHREPAARRAVERVDRKRLAYLRSIYRALPEAAGRSDDYGLLVYSAFVGMQVLFPGAGKKQRKHIRDTLRDAAMSIAGKQEPTVVPTASELNPKETKDG